MGAVTDIKLAAKSSGIATLADARTILGNARDLVARALAALRAYRNSVFDSNVDDGSGEVVTDPLSGIVLSDTTADINGGTLRASLESLATQATAYIDKIANDIGPGDGPLDEHTRDQVFAALKLAGDAFERVGDATHDPSLQIDFTGAVMEGVKLAADGITSVAKAAAAAAGQAVISLWWLVLPAGVILAWLLWRKVKRVTS